MKTTLFSLIWQLQYDTMNKYLHQKIEKKKRHLLPKDKIKKI